jgi:hypothetical protein
MENRDVKPVCDTCPSRFFLRGEFNVSGDNKMPKNFDPTKRFRIDEFGTPTCIHPDRVGLSADNYIESVRPEFVIPPAPTEIDALDVWVFNALTQTPEADIDTVLDRLHKLCTIANISEELFVDACRHAFAQLAQQ